MNARLTQGVCIEVLYIEKISYSRKYHTRKNRNGLMKVFGRKEITA